MLIDWKIILLSVYQIVVILTIIHVVMDNRQPAKTMAWALVIWFVPVVGIVLYLFFGVNTRKERLARSDLSANAVSTSSRNVRCSNSLSRRTCSCLRSIGN